MWSNGNTLCDEQEKKKKCTTHVPDTGPASCMNSKISPNSLTTGYIWTGWGHSSEVNENTSLTSTFQKCKLKVFQVSTLSEAMLWMGDHSRMLNTAALAEWLGRRTRWSCWRYGVWKVVSSIPGRGNIVGWVFHPTRWLARFSLIYAFPSKFILNLFRTLSSWGSINYKPSALLL